MEIEVLYTAFCAATDSHCVRSFVYENCRRLKLSCTLTGIERKSMKWIMSYWTEMSVFKSNKTVGGALSDIVRTQ